MVHESIFSSYQSVYKISYIHPKKLFCPVSFLMKSLKKLFSVIRLKSRLPIKPSRSICTTDEEGCCNDCISGDGFLARGGRVTGTPHSQRANDLGKRRGRDRFESSSIVANTLEYKFKKKLSDKLKKQAICTKW